MHAWQYNLHDLHRPVSMRDISKLAAYLGDLQQKIVMEDRKMSISATSWDPSGPAKGYKELGPVHYQV